MTRTKKLSFIRISKSAVLSIVLSIITLVVLAQASGYATFKFSDASSAPPTIVKTTQGNSEQGDTVSTAEDVSIVNSDTYLAFVTMKPYFPVKSIEGLGSEWVKIKTQCSGRAQTGVDVWIANTSPTTAGKVRAVFSDKTLNSIISVVQISGVNKDIAIKTTGLNTKGLEGDCSSGIDSSSYTTNLTPSANSLVIGAISSRFVTQTSSDGFTEIFDFHTGGSNGDKAGLALTNKYFGSSTETMVKGTLSGTIDWGAIFVQIPGGTSVITQASPTFAPTPTATATSTSRPSTTPTSTATARPTSTPTVTIRPTASPTQTPSVGVVSGIWTSPEELRDKPMSGEAWTQLKSAADSLSFDENPDLDNQDDSTNVKVLAAAIVYARSGDRAYRDKVVNALVKVEQYNPVGRSLAWGREVGAYAMSADLIGYRTSAFEKKMCDFAENYKCSQMGVSMLEMYKKRPNNWGTMAFGSLTAIYSYLGDTQKLTEVRNHYVNSVSGIKASQTEYGELSWQCDPTKPRMINAKNCVISCGGSQVNVDGIIPDDMRRGGSCSATPVMTGYPWEAMQGYLMGARVLERAGMPIWNDGDSAICRAASALQDGRFGSSWKATGDDQWQLPFLDEACGKNWSASYGSGKWTSGKNAGWGYVVN